MKLSIISFVIATILATGNCTTCYQCVEGERTNDLVNYQTCNQFIKNPTCESTWFSSACVTYISEYLHKRTVVHDCYKEERPIKSGPYETKICSSNYCNRNEHWGHYNKASSATLHTSLGIILIVSLYFL